LNLFLNCGIAYMRRYIQHDAAPQTLPMIRGSGVHEAIATNHRQKKDSARDLARKDLAEIAAEYVRQAAAKGVMLTPDEKSVGLNPSVERTRMSALGLAEVYADRCAPDTQPELVEAEIVIAMPTAPVDLKGTIDVATREKRIRDYKTSKRAKSQREADESLQLSLYGLAYRALQGCDPSGYDLEVLIDSGKKTDHKRLATTRGHRDFVVLVNRINALLKARETGTFAPANVGHWLCGPRYCNYWPTCAYVNAERAEAASENS
jgi:hypothetical protein